VLIESTGAYEAFVRHMSDQSYKFSEYQVPKSEVTVFAVS
jgi:hypothetical protein